MPIGEVIPISSKNAPDETSGYRIKYYPTRKKDEIDDEGDPMSMHHYNNTLEVDYVDIPIDLHRDNKLRKGFLVEGENPFGLLVDLS